MARKQPIGPPSPDRIKLDPLQDEATIGEVFILPAVEMIGLQNLTLQRNGQTILSAAIAKPDQNLTAFNKASDHQRLQPGKIGQTVGIALG